MSTYISWFGPNSISKPLIGSTRRPLRALTSRVGPIQIGGARRGDQIRTIRSLFAGCSKGSGVTPTSTRQKSLLV